MCVIIHKPAGVAFPEADIKLAHSNNPHGFGYVYYDPIKDTLICKKSVDYKEEQIIKIFKALIPYEVVFHFRWRTHGHSTAAQAHPFRVLKKENHGIDMFFTHNGTIHAVDTKDTSESDTMAFNRLILKPILKKAPSLIEETAFHELLLKYIGTGSKLCFMYGKGHVMITNPSAGADRAGCWVSNEYSFRPNHRGGNTQTHQYNRGTNNQQNNGSPQINGEVGPTVKFGDMMVRKGTEVIVCTSANKEYWSEGIIQEVNQSTCFIKFTSLENKEETMAFHNFDCTSYLQNGFYQAWPVDGDVIPDSAKKDSKIVNMQDFKKGSEPEKKTQSETNQEAEEGNSQANTQGMERDILTMPVTEPDTTSANSGGANPEEAIEPVSHKGFDLDAKDRYMGYNVEACNDYWGVTMQDIAEMEPQKRFEFFLDHMEVSFMMFQDAIEYVVLEDTDYIEDNVEFYASEEELEEYEQPNFNKESKK